MTYYDILEVSNTASQETIEAAYETMISRYHPAVYAGDQAFAKRKMKYIDKAYSILSDTQTRAKYDRYLKEQNNQESTEGKRRETIPEKSSSAVCSAPSTAECIPAQTGESSRSTKRSTANVPFIFQYKLLFFALMGAAMSDLNILFYVSLILLV